MNRRFRPKVDGAPLLPDLYSPSGGIHHFPTMRSAWSDSSPLESTVSGSLFLVFHVTAADWWILGGRETRVTRRESSCWTEGPGSCDPRAL